MPYSQAHPRSSPSFRSIEEHTKMRLSIPLIISAIIIGLASTATAVSEEDSAVIQPGANLAHQSINRPVSRKLKSKKVQKGVGEECFTEAEMQAAHELIGENFMIAEEVGPQSLGCALAVTKALGFCGFLIVRCVLACVASGGLACPLCFGTGSPKCVSSIGGVINKCAN